MAPNRRKHVPLWYSNNKVLIGNGQKHTKHHARNPNFDTEETRLLISLWGDPKVQKTLITTHKKSPVIEKLAQSMRENGYYRSPEEINTRIKNLKCLYNRIKKDLEMGVMTEPTWKHYSAMNEIINRPIFGRSAAEERARLQQEQLAQQQNLTQKQQTASSSSTTTLLTLATAQQKQKTEIDLNNKKNIEIILSGDEEDDMDDDDEDDDDDDDENDDDDDDYDFDIDIDDDIIDEEFLREKSFTTNRSKRLKRDHKTSNVVNKTTSVQAKTMTTATTTTTAAVAVATSLAIKSSTPVLSLNEIKVEETFIIPKEEPIDIEEMEIEDAQLGTHHGFSISASDATSINPTVTNAKNIMPPTSIISTSQGTNIIQFSQAPFVFTTSANTTQAGKISLVPTNVLLKPQQKQQQQQQHGIVSAAQQVQPQLTFKSPQILYTNQANGTASVASKTQPVSIQQTHTGLQMNSNSGMPMKVLLVNRMPQQNQQTATPVSTPAPQTQAQTIKIKENTMTTHTKPNVIPKVVEPVIKSTSRPVDNSKKHAAPGFRSLLTHLVQVEKQNLEVNKRRLDVERERLDFERSVADKILSALAIFQPKIVQVKTKSRSVSPITTLPILNNIESLTSQSTSDNNE